MKDNKGFTLLELSIVMIILGFLTVSSLNITRGYIEYNKYKETKEKIEIIRNSIDAFIIKNNRLPKPANMEVNYNNASAVESTTQLEKNGILIGTIPSESIGLNKKELADSWDNKFNYFVDKKLTENLLDDSITEKFAYVILSTGKNKIFSYNFSSTTAKDNFGSEYNQEKEASYYGFISFNKIDEYINSNRGNYIINYDTRANIVQKLDLFENKCKSDFNKIKDDINTNCNIKTSNNTQFFINNISNNTNIDLEYSQAIISEESWQNKTQIIESDGQVKEKTISIDKCIIKCEKYGILKTYLTNIIL